MSFVSVFSAADNTPGTSFNFGDIGSGFTAGRTWFAIVASHDDTVGDVPTSIVADGLTWTQTVAILPTNRSPGIFLSLAVWQGTGTPAGGDVTLTFAESKETAAISLVETDDVFSSVGTASGDSATSPLSITSPSGVFASVASFIVASAGATSGITPSITELSDVGDGGMSLSSSWLAGHPATVTATHSGPVGGFAGITIGLVAGTPTFSIAGSTERTSIVGSTS